MKSLSFIFCCILLFFSFAPALPGENYVFERLWPPLKQPWYFDLPYGVAADMKGYIYVTNSAGDLVQKFTSDGYLVTQWGTEGSGDGAFEGPDGIAVDPDGFVYVADSGNSRIQKFTSDGAYLTQWGAKGSGNGEFNLPRGIATDAAGFVYVADTGNHRIQKFRSDGAYLSRWGTKGSGNGELDTPVGVAASPDGSVYVTDRENDRVQKFTSDGIFIGKWGETFFSDPQGIAVDAEGFVYVNDMFNHRIQKFTSGGELVSQWGSEGAKGGQFNLPYGMAADPNGCICVADVRNHRIQKFASDGTLLAVWGGSDEGGRFNWPYGIAADPQGILYVADTFNHRVQKFESDGALLSRWGVKGNGDAEFDCPYDVAVDAEGFVYAADRNNRRIQKFTAEGKFVNSWGAEQLDSPQGIGIDTKNNDIYVADGSNSVFKFTKTGDFIRKWGVKGSGDGQFDNPHDVAVDDKGFVYVADVRNHRIQKFTAEGEFLLRWDGNENQKLNLPYGIAVHGDNVYVTDLGNHRIQKFAPDGQFLASWGEKGSFPGQMIYPAGVAVISDGTVYIADTDNHRIQAFKNVTLLRNSKAVILAGGGPGDWNNLWDATEMTANFAYRALVYRGFTKESIYYLTSDTDLDLDRNGEPDDADGDATKANLQHAITEWAKDAENLVLYLVDHGGDRSFRVNNKETLSAAELGSWLNTAQTHISGNVIAVYDACGSGSFLSSLTAPSGKKRMIVASTSPGEAAYFVTQGSVSFSTYFWSHIFSGYSVKDAFETARNAMSILTEKQHPLLDADGNGTGNESQDEILAGSIYIGYIGNIPSAADSSSPIISLISPEQTVTGKNAASLYAEVADPDGIARVWAVIRPPDYRQSVSGNPVYELPRVDFLPRENNRWKAEYSGFDIRGTYQIAVYAKDRIGNTAVPKLTTVSVESPLRRRAVIVLGESPSDMKPALANMGKTAYNALRFQGYSDEDIYVMNPETSSEGWDALPTSDNIRCALEEWGAADTQDMLLYLAGKGESGKFAVSENESLSASDLSVLLDTLQKKIAGRVIFIYDADYSGSFLEHLRPPEGKERILITGIGKSHPEYFLSQGEISFSGYFWRGIANGETVRDAFVHAKKSASFQCKDQMPQMDDNGNGIGNDDADGALARQCVIGSGIMLADDTPVIGTIFPDQKLAESSSATIWAKDVSSTGTIAKVWAVVMPPISLNPLENTATVLPDTELVYNSVFERYEGVYEDFSAYGAYTAAVYAKDKNGNISSPVIGRFYKYADPIQGDINGDGAVNLRDAVIVMRNLSGADHAGIRADYAVTGIVGIVDVNGDHKAGMAEAIFALRLAAFSGVQK
jgi:DNA-binding beta-propeller fold protein YncE